MSLRPKKINSRGKSNSEEKNTKQKLETQDQISIINVKPHLKENDKSAQRHSNGKARKFYGSILNLAQFIRRVTKKQKHHNTQKEAFDASMKYLLIFAQIFGLFPFKEKIIPKGRWPVFSWRYAFCIYMCVIQLLAAVLSFKSLVSATVTVTKIGYFSFYLITFVTTIFFLCLSTKWDYLTRQLEAAELSEYIDPYIEYKCNFAIFLVLGLTIVDLALGIKLKWTVIKECISDDTNVLKPLILANFYWLYDLGLPYSMGFGIYLMIQNFVIIISWSYIHAFVICISFYLSSILAQINKVILSREGQYLPPSYWRKLREDFNCISRLVRCFDDAINSIILTSFASNLFFLLLQLYFILANGVQTKLCNNPYKEAMGANTPKANIRFFSVFSVILIMLRSFAVALFAARVNSESLVAAPALYSVPSPTYCDEVQRFIEQIRGNTVALTGLNFFYVTKELILSVIGTIVTYELVLLQFGKI